MLSVQYAAVTVPKLSYATDQAPGGRGVSSCRPFLRPKAPYLPIGDVQSGPEFSHLSKTFAARVRTTRVLIDIRLES